MKKNTASLVWDKLQKEIKKKKKTLTTRSFRGQMVFVHDEDGSYFIFYDAFVHKILIPHYDSEEDHSYEHKFHVVFSRYLEPHAFHYNETCVCIAYGEECEKTWEKEKVYRPRLIRKPAKDYLRKNKRVLTCKDFNLDEVLVDIKWYARMCLRFARVERDGDTTYIFTEHQGYYAFKHKEIRELIEIGI